MGDFKITDRRAPRDPRQKLITQNVNRSLSEAKNERLNQITGPKDERARKDYNVRLDETLTSKDLSDRVKVSELRSGNSRLTSSMRREGFASSTTLAFEKRRLPLETVKNMGIDYDSLDDEETRKRIRDWCRGYYTTHPLVSLCVDIYTRFPIQGIHFECKDPELQEFYEQLFFDELEYEDFLVDLGREFWISGEVTSLANFNEALGVWDDEEILNPDSLQVTYSRLQRDYDYQIKVPEYLKDIVDTQQPFYEYEMLKREYPEIVRAAMSDELLSVSNTLMSRSINKTSPWDVYGTPHMLKSFRQLMMEESLNAAQDAIADRLYAPFILAKMGMPDAGDGRPWIPTPEDLDNFTQDINAALAADFKLLTHHFGVDIKSVFGRESMPRFDNDYDRLERKQLQVWGIGESLISGSSNGAYASSALNRDLLTQLMTSWQKKVVSHYERRARVVAEAQGHYDYEVSGGIRTPIYEEVLVYNEEKGVEEIVSKPKLLIPKLKFQALNLRDETTERQFLQTLKANGLPISDRTLSANIGIDFDDELEKSVEEKVLKTVSEEEFKKRARTSLKSKGLPIPEDLQEPQELSGPVQPSTHDSLEEDGEGRSRDEGVGDISDPVRTPNVAPAEDNPTSDVVQLPRNNQRPPESDEYRQSEALRFMRKTPQVGESASLSRDEVINHINRPKVSRKRGSKIRREVVKRDDKNKLKLSNEKSEKTGNKLYSDEE